MRTTLTTLCFTAGMMLAFVSDVAAQQSAQRPVARHERVARANWQPVRGSATSVNEEDDAVRREIESSQRNQMAAPRRNVAQTKPSGQIRRVGHVDGNLPAPPNTGPISVVQSVPTPTPLDGQVVSDEVVYQSTGAPIYEGGYDSGVMSYGGVACDAMPGGGCGCDSAVCTGDCGGCDSMGSCGTGLCGGRDCAMCGELCSGPAWRPAITIRLPQDGWFSYELLGWWQDGLTLPPLVSTSPQGTPRATAGVLGQPGTSILFGDGDVLESAVDGGRLRFGIWLDRCHTWGVGAEYFNIGSETDSLSATSNGDPILARPFFNTQTGVEDSELVAFPNVVSGTVTARATSELSGGGFHFRNLRCCNQGCDGGWLCGWFCGCSTPFCSRTEVRFGYRYLQLDESVAITEDLTSTDTANPGTFDILDQFDTRNQFNGFDLGWSYRQVRGYWNCDAHLKLAIGNTHQIVTVGGQTTVNDPTDPPPATLQGGLLTQTSNIGQYTNDEFAVVPEFGLDVGYQLTDQFRLMFGYTAIYWSNVVRPGDHISRDLNTDLLPPPADPFTGAQRPAFALNTTDYWVQGINFGGEYRW